MSCRSPPNSSSRQVRFLWWDGLRLQHWGFWERGRDLADLAIPIDLQNIKRTRKTMAFQPALVLQLDSFITHSNTNSTSAISKVPGTLSFLRVFVAKIHGFLRCQGRKSAQNGSWISLPRATSMPPRSLRKARRGAAWIEFWHGASHKMVLEAEFQPFGIL